MTLAAELLGAFGGFLGLLWLVGVVGRERRELEAALRRADERFWQLFRSYVALAELHPEDYQ